MESLITKSAVPTSTEPSISVTEPSVGEVLSPKVGSVKLTKIRKPRKKGESSLSTIKVDVTSDHVVYDDHFMVNKGLHSILKNSILRRKRNIMLLGPTGVGKTELMTYMSRELGMPITIFDMGTMSDPIMSLVGSHVIKNVEGSVVSKFVPSRFSQVIQKPGIVLLDEISRAPAAANNLLFPCLDFRRELPMEYSFEDCAPIKIHENCIFIATANLGSQYTGTHKLDKALINRFLVLEIDHLDSKGIDNIIKKYKISTGDRNKVAEVYKNINKSHDDFVSSFSLTIRDLKNICEMVEDGFTIYDSYYSVCKGIGGKEGLASIDKIIGSTK